VRDDLFRGVLRLVLRFPPVLDTTDGNRELSVDLVAFLSGTTGLFGFARISSRFAAASVASAAAASAVDAFAVASAASAAAAASASATTAAVAAAALASASAF
jgi:hypothetical protein